MVDAREEIKSSGLVYSSDSMPGIYRKGTAGKFYYVDKEGKRIHDDELLTRVKGLVLPPAWTNV